MENGLNASSVTGGAGTWSARVGLVDFMVPSWADVVIVARHYYPTFGGLQNFADRLATALLNLGQQPLVVSLDESPNLITSCETPPNGLVPNVRVAAQNRSLFWQHLPASLGDIESHSVVIAIGLEQISAVSEQLHALAEIAESGHTSILRVATTGDFAARVDDRLVETCNGLHSIVVLNSAMQAEVQSVLPSDSPCIVQQIPVIGGCSREAPGSPALRQQWRKNQGISPSAFLALWAGRPVRRKRLRKLIRIWLEAGVNGTLLLAGLEQDSEEPEVLEVLRFVGENPLVDIRLLPPVSAERMTSLYSAADCFLFTSEREGMSNAVVEALSHGLPVLGSDIPGVRDIRNFHPSADLKLFSDVREDEFVQALRDQSTMIDHCGGMRHRRRAFDAWQIFSAQAVAQRYMGLFQRLQNNSFYGWG